MTDRINMDSKNNKNKYENFPIGLALFDALPVIFFSAAMIIIAMNFKVALFVAGAICSAAAGLGKVIWKIIIAATGKDIHILNIQLRALMPAGFLLMIAGMIMGMNGKAWQALGAAITGFPQIIFFGITFIGMILMGVFGAKLDSTKVKSNWIEQITNAIAQGCLLIGVLCCTI